MTTTHILLMLLALIVFIVICWIAAVAFAHKPPVEPYSPTTIFPEDENPGNPPDAIFSGLPEYTRGERFGK